VKFVSFLGKNRSVLLRKSCFFEHESLIPFMCKFTFQEEADLTALQAVSQLSINNTVTAHTALAIQLPTYPPSDTDKELVPEPLPP